MSEPTTAKGKWLVYGDLTTVDEVLRHVLTIEAQAAAVERARLRGRVESQSHFAMDHDGAFDHCDRPSCLSFRWLLADPTP